MSVILYIYLVCLFFFLISGVKVTEVQAMVENHLKDMILKTFDPKKADTIFTEEGEVSNTNENVVDLLSSYLLNCYK